MLNFLQRLSSTRVRRAPEGARIYAVGDVHGRLDALDVLLDALRHDMKDGPHPVLIMLGDYVDRGPDSRGVLDRLIGLKADPKLEARFIRGNHDDTMMNFLSDPSIGPSWCAFGGVETLRSYGVVAPAGSGDVQAWAEIRNALELVIPFDHVRFLQALEACVTYGDYFFTHAGARPGVELDGQHPDDLMWIRNEFLHGFGAFAKTVVHGHTPEPTPHVSNRRIGVDSGAYATGRLTALVLEGEERRLVQVQVGGSRFSVEHVDVSPKPSRFRAFGSAGAR